MEMIYVYMGIASLISFMIPVLFIFVFGYKNKVTLIKIVEGNERVCHTRAKEKIKDGVLWWKIQNRKFIKKRVGGLVRPPKGKCLRIDNKGRLSGIANLTSEDEPVWLELDEKNNKLTPVLDESERSLYLEQLRESDRAQKITNPAIIFPTITIIVLIIVIGAHLAFWNSISNSAISAKEKDNAILETFAGIIKTVDSLKGDVNQLKGIPQEEENKEDNKQGESNP